MTEELVIPKWAREMMAEIYHLEVSLGNILPKDQESPWFTKNFNDLLERVRQQENSVKKNADERIEFLFKKLVTGLTDEGHSVERIALMINSGVPTGSKLTYCDRASVEEILIA